MDSAELCEQFEQASAEYSYDNHLQCNRGDAWNRESLSEAESSGDEDEIGVNFSVREEDEAEERVVDDFIAKGCGCLLGPKGSPCSKSFSRAEHSITRMNCHEMSATELDMLVLAHLDAHRHNIGSEHARVPIDCYFGGKRTCKATFLFAHGIGSKKYKNLITHFENNGLVPRRHGNTKRLPANTIPFAKTQVVVGFIQHFATIHALPYLVVYQVSIVMRRLFCYHHICPRDMYTDNTVRHVQKLETCLWDVVSLKMSGMSCYLILSV